jgi:RHS repeat-associated protein
MRREGGTYFYHYDGLGSVRQLTGKRICLIATAVYGTSLAQEVEVLSRLRDEHLLTNEWGRRFVTFYYRHSPRAANFIQDNRWAQPLLRFALWPVVRIATLIVEEKDTSSAPGNPNPSPRQRQFRRVPIKAEYTYDAFGNILAVEDDDIINPYRFSTKEYSQKSGLIFFGARYYDPRIGRFITKDPSIIPSNLAIGIISLGVGFFPHISTFIPEYPISFHFYAYVANNPVNYIDPIGHSPVKARARKELRERLGAHLSEEDIERMAARFAEEVRLGEVVGLRLGDEAARKEILEGIRKRLRREAQEVPDPELKELLDKFCAAVERKIRGKPPLITP